MHGARNVLPNASKHLLTKLLMDTMELVKLMRSFPLDFKLCCSFNEVHCMLFVVASVGGQNGPLNKRSIDRASTLSLFDSSNSFIFSNIFHTSIMRRKVKNIEIYLMSRTIGTIDEFRMNFSLD